MSNVGALGCVTSIVICPKTHSFAESRVGITSLEQANTISGALCGRDPWVGAAVCGGNRGTPGALAEKGKDTDTASHRIKLAFEVFDLMPASHEGADILALEIGVGSLADHLAKGKEGEAVGHQL